MAEQKILISIEIQDKNSKRVVDSTTASLGKLEKSQKRVSKATDQTRATSGLNNAILMETSRLASDASFGFTAIANNLSQLINLFRMSKDATGGYMKSIKSLLKFSNLLLIGIQLLITFLPRIIKRFQESTKQANALGKAFSDATAQITAQRTELLAYQGLLNSNNLSLAQKEKLIRKVRKETGLENIKLNENNQLNEYSNKLIAKKIQLMMLEAQANNVKKQVEKVIADREEELLKIREKQNSSLSKFTDFVDRNTKGLQENAKQVISAAKEGLKTQSFYKTGQKLLEGLGFVQKQYNEDVNSAEAIQSRKNKTDQEASEITEKYNKQLTPLLQTFKELVKQIALTEFQMGEYSDSIQKLSAISFKDFANANKEMRDMTKNFSAQLIDDELTRNQTLLALERDYYLQSIDQSIAAEEEKAKARAAVIAFFNQEIEQENLRHFSASLDLVEQSFNEETAIAKAALFVKQAIAMQELLLDIGVLKSKAKNAATEAGLDLVVAQKDVSAGGAKVAKTANPLAIAAYALTAASIISNMIKAVKRVKEVSGASGGGAGGASASSRTIQAPDFNIVGASQTSQLAELVSAQQAKPIKAFVVGKDISTQQELDRNITNTASLG
jgi:hypothetical protein